MLKRARDLLKRVRDGNRRSHSRSDESTVGTERSLGTAAGSGTADSDDVESIVVSDDSPTSTAVVSDVSDDPPTSSDVISDDSDNPSTSSNVGVTDW